MTTVRTAPSRRPRRRSRRATATVAAAVVTTAMFAITGCSFDRDEPATVTLPEHGTTTSTSPPTLAPDSGDPGSGGTSAEQSAPPALAWAVQVGGSGDDVLRAVTGSQASVVAVGSTAAGVDEPTSGGTDVMSATVATDGTVESVDQFGSAGEDDATGVASSQDSVLACGSTTGELGAATGGSSDAWCAPLPPTTDAQVGQLGGPETEKITGLALPDDAAPSTETGTGAGYASGVIDGFFPGAEDPAGQGLGAGDALAFRVGLDGTAIWARQFGTPTEDASTGVCAVDADGVFVGYTDGDLEGPSKGARDGWISRIDASGVQRWITQFGGTGSDEFRAVAASGEARRGTEQFVAVGSTDGDIDAGGPLANSGAQDALVAAFGSDGSTIWATQLGGELADEATAVVADGSTVYVAGTTQTAAAPQDGTSAQIGLGELDPSVGPGGMGDGFLAALDATSGEVRWIVRLGTAQDETVTGMTTTEDGLLVISGSTAGQIADTPPGGGTDGFLLAFPLPSSGGGAASSV